MADYKLTPPDERYDILIFADKPETRVTDQLAGAVIQNIAARRIVRPVDEALHKDFVEVYCDPGPSAHEAFVKGGWHEDEPPYLEALFRWGQAPVDILGNGTLLAYFFIEFRGARFKDVGGRFRRIFQDVSHFRPRVLAKPHLGIPPREVVAEGDERVQLKRRSRHGSSVGTAGTHVEEF